jgi:hypothetical protein
VRPICHALLQPGWISMARRDGMKVRLLASAEIVAVGTEILLEGV